VLRSSYPRCSNAGLLVIEIIKHLRNAYVSPLILVILLGIAETKNLLPRPKVLGFTVDPRKTLELEVDEPRSCWDQS
jgi:hypothetical protein